MKIAIIAGNRKPIPSSRENVFAPGSIIKGLVDNLTALGHETVFFGPKDSDVNATRIISENLNSVHTDFSQIRQENPHLYLANELQYEMVLLSKAFETINSEGDFDLVHVHKYDKEIFFSNFINVPMLVTGHGMYSEAINTEADRIRYEKYKSSCYYVNVSEYHKFGAEDLNFVAKIPWGVDPLAFPFNPDGGDDLLFLSRMIRRKRPDFAIEVAESARKNLLLAGQKGIEAEHVEYWDQIKHLFEKEHVKFLDHIPFDETHKYFGHSKALLLPLEIGEPMPVTALEAMACGTPVIASDISPMNEIVVDGVTGFLVDKDDKDAWVHAIEKIDSIDRQKCRQRFEAEYTWEKMTERYVEAYKTTIENWKIRKARDAKN